jgi:mono/diheme cytochrome c family protein
MSRPAKVLLTAGALFAVAALASACGTEKISVPTSQSTLYEGAVLFNQRCSGCHTLSYAGAHGSAANVRTAQFNNGPNFDIRCERPVARVLYAIENGGFSGQIMPQNIVVGQQALDVAQFVATYSGRKAPIVTGSIKCENQPIGTIAEALATPVTAAATGAGGTSGSAGTTGTSTTSSGAIPATAKKAAATAATAKKAAATAAAAKKAAATTAAAKKAAAKHKAAHP